METKEGNSTAKDGNPVEDHSYQNEPVQEPARNISNLAAFVNIIKVNIGTGVLAMPNAFANAGLALGLGFMALIYIIFIHSMLLLVSSAQAIMLREKVSKLDYNGVVDAAFNAVPRMQKYRRAARIAVDTFLLMSNIGCFAVYTLFIAQNLQTVLASKAFGIDLDYRIFLAISLIPMLILCSIRNLANLSWVMGFANICEFYIISVVFYYLFRHPLPSLEGKDLAAPIDKLPISFGSIMFCYGGVGVVLPLENRMKTRQSMRGIGGVLFNGISFITLLYMAIGFFGYLVFGNQMRTSGSITLNLPHDEVLANSARLISSVAIFLSNPLLLYIAITVLYPYIAPKVSDRRKTLAEYLLRYTIVLGCYAFAAAIPRLDLFIALSGATTTAALALIIPCTLDLLVKYPNIPTWAWTKNLAMIAFGIFGSVLGTVLSVEDLIPH